LGILLAVYEIKLSLTRLRAIGKVKLTDINRIDNDDTSKLKEFANLVRNYLAISDELAEQVSTHSVSALTVTKEKVIRRTLNRAINSILDD
jgi:hypothetical protein